MIERRTQRSSNPIVALKHFLEAERKRLGVRALTVSTTQGHLVAGSGVGLESVASDGACFDAMAGQGKYTSNLSSKAVATWRVQVGKEQFVVTSLGRKMTADLGDGVRRIMAACGDTDGSTSES